MKGKSYTQEFKREAVELTYSSGKSVGEVAADLGIPSNNLFRWRRELKAEGKEAFRGHGKLTTQEEELRKLKRELAVVKQERDILKKAIAIFSGTQRP